MTASTPEPQQFGFSDDVLATQPLPWRDGLFAGTNYIDLHEIDDREERKRRIRAALEGKTPSYTPPPARIAGSPPPRLKLFAGRDDELARLDAILTGGGKPVAITQARAAVSGQGGVGKTSLAAEYMYRFRDFYAGVCWCDARGDDGPMLGLAAPALSRSGSG